MFISKYMPLGARKLKIFEVPKLVVVVDENRTNYN